VCLNIGQLTKKRVCIGLKREHAVSTGSYFQKKSPAQYDVKATLKKKLDVDFKKYRILGACNPPFAFKALQVEDKIGTMLPCNVIVQPIAIMTTAGGMLASIFAVSRMLAMLTEMKLVPHSHFGMPGSIQKHTLVYTVENQFTIHQDIR
jgi:hypothetical protein